MGEQPTTKERAMQLALNYTDSRDVSGWLNSERGEQLYRDLKRAFADADDMSFSQGYESGKADGVAGAIKAIRALPQGPFVIGHGNLISPEKAIEAIRSRQNNKEQPNADKA